MDYIAPLAKAYARKLPKQLYSTWDKELLPRLYAVFEDGYTLLTSKPSLETVLPLVISLLLIYATIISIYNTARFVLRTLIFVVKWTVILATLITVVQLSSRYTGKDVSSIVHASTPSLFSYFGASNSKKSASKSRYASGLSYDGLSKNSKPRKKTSKTKEDVNELINGIINSVLN